MSESGRVVGSLSAWSTAGALVGTFLTGFVLVATLPTTRILYLTSIAVSVLGITLTARGRWPKVAGVMLLLVTGAGVVAVESDLCLEETRYYCVRIREARDDAAARVLRLDTLSHSYVDLDDRRRLGFRYQRVVSAAIEERHPDGAAVDVLHVGGGGYAFPRFVAATRPGSVNRVLELDDGLLDIATSYLDLDPAAVSARSGDARTALADEPPGAYDFVVADTFGSLDPPWHLATAETAALVRRLLRAGGVYAVNIVDAGPRDFGARRGCDVANRLRARRRRRGARRAERTAREHGALRFRRPDRSGSRSGGRHRARRSRHGTVFGRRARTR